MNDHGHGPGMRCPLCLIEELQARVAELEAAIHSHKDHYIFTTPDFEDLELWKLVEPKP